MNWLAGYRTGQVLFSLFAGLLLWEIAGWQFNTAFFAPVLGSDVGFSNSIAHALANAFGYRITEDHPGTIPKLISSLDLPAILERYADTRSGGAGIVASILAAFTASDLLMAMGSSLKLFLTGLSFALLAGLGLGMAMARMPWLRIALEDYILGLYATPMAALIPFILAIFGFEFWPKVLVVFLFALFPVLYNTLEGARSLKPEYLEVARSFRTREWRLWKDVIIPYTLPFAMTGLRQGVARALVGMIAGEILLNPTGLGDLLIGSERAFDMAGVLATILVVTLLGTVLMFLVRAIETRYIKWGASLR
ncbi:MAG: ABC transporter permease subunit [Hyphomicrobiales bacterium]|nr:ABC transporter permease subunit [Hyphomicrobiales bacterium]